MAAYGTKPKRQPLNRLSTHRHSGWISSDRISVSTRIARHAPNLISIYPTRPLLCLQAILESTPPNHFFRQFHHNRALPSKLRLKCQSIGGSVHLVD